MCIVILINVMINLSCLLYCSCFAKQVRYIVALIFNRAGQTYRESWRAKEKKAKKIKKKNPTTQTPPPPNKKKQENITKPRIFKIFRWGGGGVGGVVI